MTTRSPNARPLLVVIGSGAARHYREYSLRALARTYDIALIDDVKPTWQLSYIHDFRVVSIDDVSQVEAAVAAIASRRRPAGVLSWDERRIVCAAEVAARLGLPHTPAQDVRACRDKFMTRALLARHGVPSARSFLVRNEQEACARAEELGWPVVVKPRSLAGSIGVLKVTSADHMFEAWQHARDAVMPGVSATGEVLVEEYLDGPEISVECVSNGGTTTVVAVARKRLGPEPHFEEIGHTVDSTDPLARSGSAVVAVAQSSLRALGVMTGVSHVEIRLTARGPRVVEVNARLGGDLIPVLVELTTGIDLSKAAGDVATGRPPNLEATRSGAAAIRFLYPAAKGTFVGFATDPDTIVAPWIHTICRIAEPGADVAPPPDAYLCRLGFAVVTGPDSAVCEQRLDSIENRLAPWVEPVGANLSGAWRVR